MQSPKDNKVFFVEEGTNKVQHLYPELLFLFVEIGSESCVGVTPVRLGGTGFNLAVPRIPARPNLPATLDTCTLDVRRRHRKKRELCCGYQIFSL